MDEHPREKLQRGRGLGAGGGALGLVGAIGDGLGRPVVGQSFQGDGIPCAVPREAGREGPIVLGDPDGRVHVEARVRPGEHPGGLVLVEELQPHEQPEDGAAQRFREAPGVMDRPRHERPVRPEPALGDQEVQGGMPVGARAVRLETGHDPHREVALTRQPADRGRDGASRDAGDLAEQAPTIQAIGAEQLRDREDDLPVGNGRKQRRVQPLGPDGEPLCVAARAEVPALTREREQIFVRTGVTADAREPVLEDAAGQELVGDLCDHAAPRAVLAREALIVHRLQPVEMILHQPKQRRRLGAPWLVDAARRRHRVCQTHSATVERPAYA